MSNIREAIKQANRLSRMRLGQLAPELVDIPSLGEVRVALVPLVEVESKQGLLAAAALDLPENYAGIEARNRTALVHNVWMACRDPQNVDEKVWGSPQEMESEIEASDIDYLAMHLTVLMDYAAPSLATLTDEQLNELKKAFETIPWRELSGTQAAAVKVFLSTILPRELLASWYGSTSTENLTRRTESDESTSAASASTTTD